MRGDLIRKLEQIEAVFSAPGSNREQLEAIPDVELDALVAWFEAGEPDGWERWTREWIEARQPEPVERAHRADRVKLEAPPPAPDPSEPAEVADEPPAPTRKRVVVTSGELSVNRPTRPLEVEVTMVKAPPTAWRYELR